MRPSSADTSEPACVKRKMLSTKNSTSWPWSRKYSATVRPDRPTRARAPGGSFIWPHTGEHGIAAVRLGDVVDQLLDQHGLADAGAAEQADLAALRIRGKKIDDLD